jgi:endonuclease III
MPREKARPRRVARGSSRGGGRAAPIGLREAVVILREHYGRPTPLPTADPFELVLLENVAYLALPARRHEAFAQLESAIGTKPAAILAADPEALLQVTAHGILGGRFAAKLRECAEIALGKCGGDLSAAIRDAPARARRTLRLFPGIGEPGADKVLLFSGLAAELAPESNGLRVLVRLGLVEEKSSYARTYAASRQVKWDGAKGATALQEAHLLLRQHGQTLCRNRLPRCGACPLESRCAYARSAARR